MLDSAAAILNHYIDGASRFTIYSIEMERGENPEDLYYLCWAKSGWYVVFEADYIHSLTYVVEEAVALFGVRPLHWLVNKDHQASTGIALPLEAPVDDESSRRVLVLRQDGSYLRHVVLAVEATGPDEKRYDPNVYGFAK